MKILVASFSVEATKIFFEPFKTIQYCVHYEERQHAGGLEL